MSPGTPPLSLIPPIPTFQYVRNPSTSRGLHSDPGAAPGSRLWAPATTSPWSPVPSAPPASTPAGARPTLSEERSGHHAPQLLILQRLLVTLTVRSALLTGRAGSAQPSELMSTLYTALQTFCLIAHSCFWAFVPALPSAGIPHPLPGHPHNSPLTAVLVSVQEAALKEPPPAPLLPGSPHPLCALFQAGFLP